MNRKSFAIIVTSALMVLCLLEYSKRVSVSNDNCDCTSIISDSIYVYKPDTIIKYLHDTVYIRGKQTIKIVRQVIPELEILDSLQLAKEMSNILAYGFMLYQPSKNDIMPSLVGLDDLSLLPYLLNIYSNKQIYPHGNYEYLQYLTDLCTTKINDQNLFVLGKQVVENIKANVPHQYGRYVSNYPNSFKKASDYNNCKELINGALVSLDSLRTRALAHNDRDALAKLEKYYHDKGDDKGIAIYYKVLLGYEGNGDLAERFYRVLEPHFGKTPELRFAVREVLLRAALCDHNERAQELCDSLGFSICDYRLPVQE